MKNVYFERLGIVIAVVFFVFSSYIVITRAGLFGGNDDGDLPDAKNTGVYYFTNAVDTSPEEVGNYFYDSKLSDQANELPDFNSFEVHIVSEAIFDGNITFIGEGENSGTVNGDAEFIGDQSENYGTVSGTLTRRYIESVSTGKDFTQNNEHWTVIADGAEVDVTTAIYNGNTTFLSQNHGSFVSDMNVVSATVTDANLRLDYDRTLDGSSLPAAGDFTIMVNHEAVEIASVNISGEEVEIRLTNPVTAEDQVSVSYSLGDNLILSEQGLNSMHISDFGVTNETLALNNNNNGDEDEDGDQENNQGNDEENNQQEESVQTPHASSGGIGVFPLSSLKLDVQKNEKKRITEKTEKKDAKSDEVIKEDETESTSASVETAEATKEVTQKTKESIEVTEKLKNSLLLAVEDKGTIWYVAPTDSKRYEVSSGNALNLFKKVTLGITNKNLEQVPVAGTTSTVSPLAKRLTGRFLLQVESRGESWYVDNSGYRHRVNSDNLVETVKKSVQGINNQTLNKIPVSK